MTRHVLLVCCIVAFLLGTMLCLGGENDSVWLPVIKRGGVQLVKIDDKGVLQSFVVVGSALENNNLASGAAKRDMQVRATLDAKQKLAQWLGAHVTSIETASEETKIIVAPDGKERATNSTYTSEFFQSYAKQLVIGARPIYIHERTVENLKELVIVLGWSRKELNKIKDLNSILKQEQNTKENEQEISFDDLQPFETDRFSEICIMPEFSECLLADIPMMELGGARIYALPDGSRILISVANTITKEKSPKELLRREKVASEKAKANLQRMRGVQVTSVTKHLEQMKIIETTNEEPQVEHLEELFESTQETTRGLVSSLPKIGTWYSKDRIMFYFAIGCKFPSKRK